MWGWRCEECGGGGVKNVRVYRGAAASRHVRRPAQWRSQPSVDRSQPTTRRQHAMTSRPRSRARDRAGRAQRWNRPSDPIATCLHGISRVTCARSGKLYGQGEASCAGRVRRLFVPVPLPPKVHIAADVCAACSKYHCQLARLARGGEKWREVRYRLQYTTTTCG